MISQSWVGQAVPGPWQSWTPSWVNLTIGNATVVAKYIQIGKTVVFKLLVTLGTTSTMGTSPTFTLPIVAPSDITGDDTTNIFTGQILDAGTARFGLSGTIATTTTGAFTVTNATGTYLQYSGITSTVPMTWTTGDKFFITGTYEGV